MSINALGMGPAASAYVKVSNKNAVTDNGSTYQRTKGGRGLGIGVGAAIGTGMAFKVSSSGGYKMLGKLAKFGPAFTILGWMLTGLGLGAIVDKVSNNKRAAKADIEQGNIKLG